MANHDPHNHPVLARLNPEQEDYVLRLILHNCITIDHGVYDIIKVEDRRDYPMAFLRNHGNFLEAL